MGFLVQENTNIPRFQEHRPMLLKDFLRDDASHSWSTVAHSSKSKKTHIVLLRSWSKRAAATKISAVHKVIKLLQFASTKSPSALPRSISKRLTKRGIGNDDIFGDVSEIKVKVKDILRWRSFRDMAEDDRSSTTTTTEELQPWDDENEEFKNPKGDWLFEEYEKQSPVSVLDSPFGQVQEFTISPKKEINVHRETCGPTRTSPQLSLDGETKEVVNATEEKAKKLIRNVACDDDGVILDFFTREISVKGKLNDEEFEREILRIAKSWMKGEFEESYEWKAEEKRESFVKDMEKGICWNKFREEEQELCKGLEVRVLNDLLDHLVTDFLAR